MTREAPTRVCRECGTSYPLVFFRKNHATYAHDANSATRPICKRCEQNRRDASKKRDPWRVKALDTTRGHARKLGISVDAMRNEYRWEVDRMARDAEHVYSGTCHNCDESFGAMAHGLADITLDIIDPDAPPTYGVNTRWICMTCNREKGRMPLARYAELQRCWSIARQSAGPLRLFDE